MSFRYRDIGTREDYSKAFREAENNKGYVTYEDMVDYVRCNGYPDLDESIIKSMFKAIDRNGDNKITYDEFMIAMGKETDDVEQRIDEKLQKVFLKFDKKRTGRITSDDLRLIIDDLKIKASEAEKKRTINRVENYYKGILTYEEFKEVIERANFRESLD